MKPYALISDIHLHNWSSFSEQTSRGNSRLVGLLDEIVRAANELEVAGGRMIVFAGDIFHVRGSIAPSVLVPTLDVFRTLKKRGFTLLMIPGNHDLETKDSNRLSSAVTALEDVGVEVMNTYSPLECSDYDHALFMVPWVEDLNELREKLRFHSAYEYDITDLIIHAPINGVIKGLPDTGLTPEELSDLGFKRVFAGHYHNHKQLNDTVYSIGALAHHTWSDVGTKAGFLLVYPDRVVWRKSHLPDFMDLAAEDLENETELALRVDGHYVRVRTNTTKMEELNRIKRFLLDSGAKGVVLMSTKKPEVERSTAVLAAAAGHSLEASIAEFVKSKSYPNGEQVTMQALKCLAEAAIEE